ncbi:MAG: hypothetical protein MZU91_10970 [Desulfosudis oleivorans]|nr:hypothetical protein [Desulfosudis oleivorans]
MRPGPASSSAGPRTTWPGVPSGRLTGTRRARWGSSGPTRGRAWRPGRSSGPRSTPGRRRSPSSPSGSTPGPGPGRPGSW